MTCALVPGLKNRQEIFCNNQPGPDGLSAPNKRQDGGSLSGSKRTADSSVKDAVHTLPYSYDVVGMGIGISTMQMMYNETSREMLTTNQDACATEAEEQHMKSIDVDDLPQLSLRFVGYDEQNRQTLLLKIGYGRPEGQDYIEAGDPHGHESSISMKHVERSLGREVGMEEMLRYISRRQGARRGEGLGRPRDAQDQPSRRSLAGASRTKRRRVLSRGRTWHAPRETAPIPARARHTAHTSGGDARRTSHATCDARRTSHATCNQESVTVDTTHTVTEHTRNAYRVSIRCRVSGSPLCTCCCSCWCSVTVLLLFSHCPWRAGAVRRSSCMRDCMPAGSTPRWDKI